ncbi:FkbM family methyltransferase [Paenibacillus sp. FSL H7-0756]|uniref:FkbM family methyltransferase n=1 Tax=Paenibacillus sp. FSL H7-0756 TaxID=2954738 RepID=UPI0030F9B129
MINQFSLKRLESRSNRLSELIANDSINNQRPLILYGSGSWGVYYLNAMKDLFKDFVFCDGNPSKWGTTVEGIPVINPEELKTNYRDCHITITSLDYYDEIYQQIKEFQLQERLVMALEGFRDDQLKDYYNLIIENCGYFSKTYDALSDELSQDIFYDRLNCCISGNHEYLLTLRSKTPQYFDPKIISLSEEEIFIDGGAYTGDTVLEFLKQTNGMFKQIYSFEPEESKYKDYFEISSKYDNIQLLTCGLWSKRDVLRFNAVNDGSSGVSENGIVEIPVISIDELLDGKPVTFIKMDIEGAELEALKGAQETIKKYKPKLAICVYHKPLDIVEIPLFLKQLVPEYKIYLRHYNISMYETVCYAVV